MLEYYISETWMYSVLCKYLMDFTCIYTHTNKKIVVSILNIGSYKQYSN